MAAPRGYEGLNVSCPWVLQSLYRTVSTRGQRVNTFNFVYSSDLISVSLTKMLRTRV